MSLSRFAAVYVVLRVLCVCAMAGQSEQTVFVDAMAATFRFIDHTAFDRYGAHLLKTLGCADEAGAGRAGYAVNAA